MSCTAPETYYQADPAKNGGKGGFTMDPRKSEGPGTITVACGKCIDCRLAHSREWALRCMHEKQLGSEASFVTFSYNDEHLPADWCLDYRHFQLFMHKLRKAIPGAGRFFMSAEYGDEFGRPHYHAILFNCFFEDRVFHKRVDGLDYWTSPQLSELWGRGFCLIGDVTMQSAGYVARYNLKKITGPAAGSAYQFVLEDGEIIDRPPPFARSSNRPGIGHDWFMKYQSDVFPCDFLVYEGARVPVPRYYSKLFSRIDEGTYESVVSRREAAARSRKDDPDFSPRRLRDKNELARLVAKQKRELE